MSDDGSMNVIEMNQYLTNVHVSPLSHLEAQPATTFPFV